MAAPSDPPRRGFATRAIHVGQGPDPHTGAVVQPIAPATTFTQPSPGRPRGYEYARTGNPTRDAVEENVASLEGGVGAVAFASGMAAIATVLELVPPGGRVVSTLGAYGGTWRLFERVLRPRGLEFAYVDASDEEAVKRALGGRADLLFLETPTNPMMEIADLAALSVLARDAGALVAVDNTFLTPFFQRPISFGADLALHSSTKYLNGHSDGVGGVVVAASEEPLARLRFLQNAAGAILSPFDSWLLLRSTKTLALRMERHAGNAMAIARRLEEHPGVGAVHYPGLSSHPRHDLARRQATGFGGMLSFDVETLGRARRLMEAFEIFGIAESLGAVESLANHPATMTHASMPPEVRREVGIGDGLVRLSVGIEDVEDLLADLDRALATLD